MPTAPSPAKSPSRRNSASPARSNGRSTGPRCATASCSPTATPSPPPRAARTRPASGPPILKGIRAYGELAKNRKADLVTRDDLLSGGCALISVFIREPQFVGQTKDRLATEARRPLRRERRPRPFRQLAGRPTRNPPAPSSISWSCAPRNASAAAPKRKPPARPPPRSSASPASSPTAPRTTARAPSFSSSRATAPAAPPRPPATAKPRPSCRLRGKILNVLGAASSKLTENAEIRDICEALGVGMGTPLPRRRPALRQDHHHDRRRRRRRAYRLAS